MKQINSEGNVRDLSVHTSQFGTTRYCALKAKSLSRKCTCAAANHADCSKRIEWKSSNVGDKLQACSVSANNLEKRSPGKTVPRSQEKNSVSVLLGQTRPCLVPIRQRHPSQLRKRSAHVGASAANRGNREPLATKSIRDIDTIRYDTILLRRWKLTRGRATGKLAGPECQRVKWEQDGQYLIGWRSYGVSFLP